MSVNLTYKSAAGKGYLAFVSWSVVTIIAVNLNRLLIAFRSEIQQALSIHVMSERLSSVR
jgi:hypothetical protein